jgi:uncharacterized membrane protein
MSDRSGSSGFSGVIGRLPADLTLVLVVVAVTVGSVLLSAPVPLRAVIGFAFVLFVPGYALVAALFPRDGTDIQALERLALSVGLSVALVAAVGLTLGFTPFGVGPVSVLASLSGITLISTGVAAFRRARLPAGERFRVPYRTWIADARAGLLEPSTRTDAMLNAVLVVALLVGVVALGVAIGFSGQDDPATEFYLVAENENGSLVAEGYPRNFSAGAAKPVVVGIDNHERQSSYIVVVQQQRVVTEDGTLRVEERRELDRLRASVPENETWQSMYQLEPELVGGQQRVLFLLYRGDAPDAPTASNAYQRTQLYIDVSSGNATG